MPGPVDFLATTAVAKPAGLGAEGDTGGAITLSPENTHEGTTHGNQGQLAALYGIGSEWSATRRAQGRRFRRPCEDSGGCELAAGIIAAPRNATGAAPGVLLSCRVRGVPEDPIHQFPAGDLVVAADADNLEPCGIKRPVKEEVVLGPLSCSSCSVYLP